MKRLLITTLVGLVVLLTVGGTSLALTTDTPLLITPINISEPFSMFLFGCVLMTVSGIVRKTQR